MKRKKQFHLIALVFMLQCTLFAYAQESSRQLTITANNEPLSTALKKVESGSGYYRVSYSHDAVSPYRVSYDIKSKTAPEAVDILIQGLPLSSSVKGRIISIIPRKSTHAKPASGVYTGVVMDKDGEPLMGAVVRMVGTDVGVVTDSEGRYELRGVDAVGDIQVSYVGKEGVVRRLTSKPLEIYLKDNVLSLDNVVVTGYQQISKERVTGSFDKVTSAELASRPSSDISSALQGLVAGMQATENEDGSVSFSIRGKSTLYADAKPLLVVDGFPVDGDFSSINPNDVESITVLKDAAAASIWGARSANGVIVVTTKKGGSGKLKVSGKAFWRIGTLPDLDYILNQADSKTTVDYELKALENGWDLGMAYSPSFNNLRSKPLSLAQEYYFANKYYGMSDEEMNAGLDELRNRNNRQQIKDLLMQTALLQQYNISLAGGNNRTDNMLSFMYEKNDEHTIKRGYERFLLNFNNGFRINSNITATASATLQKRTSDVSGVSISDFSSLSPYEMILNDDGTYARQTNTWNSFELSKIDTSQLPYSDLSYNLLQEIENRNYKNEMTSYRIQFGINAKIVKGLSWDTKYQYEKIDTNNKMFDNENTFYVRDFVDLFVDYDQKNNKVTKNYLPKGGIKRTSSSTSYNEVFRTQLNYTEDFGKHAIAAIAGYEVSKYVSESQGNPYVFGYDEKANSGMPPYYGYATPIGTITGSRFDSSRYTSTLASSFSLREDRYMSFYGNASYTYDDKYSASFSIRNDGSNFVSKDAALKHSPMWSMGLRWNAKRENFMQDAKWIDMLDLRATYGLNGNAEKSSSPQTLVSSSTSSITNTTVASIVSYGNPKLRWERTRTANFGIDFSLFNHVLMGKFEYYSRYSKDVIGSISIPSTYGTSTQRFNTAEISNRGFESELTGNFHIRPIDMGIRSTVLLSYNRNRIEKLYNTNLYCYNLVSGTTYVEGEPIGTIYSYRFAGTEDGVPYVYGANGEKVSMGDLSLSYDGLGREVMEKSGTTIAPYGLGWNTSLTWKGVTLTAYIIGKFGAVFRAPSAAVPTAGSDKVFVSALISQYDQSDGTKYPTWPNANDPYMYLWDRYSAYLSYFIEKADYIKLKEIDLSWNIQKKWLRKARISDASVFMQVRDLGCIWTANKYGYDPEWLPGSNKPSTSISLGLNISF